jgi:dTDP-glucose 4,6-dehydratase
VKAICTVLDELQPSDHGGLYSEQIRFIKDRLGHDRRYAIDATKIQTELSWKPIETFDTGLVKTLEWYLSNQDWITNVTSGDYKNWVEHQYGVK